jgi:EAL domain-containing protein (putative c-di-GMP-specific phosphodiesterase class I)/GGDEF domain-containing protein
LVSVNRRDEQQRGSSTGAVVRCAGAIVAAAALAIGLLRLHRPASHGVAIGLAIGLCISWIGWAVRERRLVRATARAERTLQRYAPTPIAGRTLDRLDRALDGTAVLLARLEQRVTQRHSVSGLPTREPLFAAIEADLAKGHVGVLGLISLADFERLIAFDPAAADEMLVAIVDRARRMLGERRLIAQIDRARLAIWFGPESQTDVACAQLDALGYALGAPIQAGGQEWLPEVRVATACVPPEGATAQGLLARAIGALSQGGAIAAEPTADPVEAARERYAMEQDLRRAIERNEFELRFQPLIDADARRVCGAEALLRWTHPVHGPVPPSRFVPIVEAAGLADEVGLWVLNAACREARTWQRQGLGPLRVAVNISGHQLDRSDLHALIERTLARHSLGADTLEVELTETVAAGDAGRTAALFRHLRALGVAIAIDDFGTGYSSFSALRQLSFDKLKIDREFVTAVDQRRDSQAICRSMIALGHGLGIRVLAEGVERREEYDWLRRHGCGHFQGYYFAPPLDSLMFQAFVQDGAQLTGRLGPHPVSRPERLRA